MVPASPPLAGVDVAGVEIIGGSGRRQRGDGGPHGLRAGRSGFLLAFEMLA